MATTKVRALKVFKVQYKGIKLHVRVLRHAKDVYAEMTGGVKWRKGNAAIPEGFFLGNCQPCKHTGMIVVAGNSELNETVPHEVVHAVLWRMESVHTKDDEPFAYAVGALTRLILDGIGTITLVDE